MSLVGLSVALASGGLIGLLLGLRLASAALRKEKGQRPSLKEKRETVVLFFPDETNALAADTKMSRESKGVLYKQILDHCNPLDAMIGQLNSANHSIDLCLFMLTCHKLGEAVLGRLEKNVRVRLVMDDSNAHLSGSLVSTLRRQGAFVKMVKSDYLMHHKFAIVDSSTVMTGSFNWTMQAAMGNHENVIISSHPSLVNPFTLHFHKMWDHL